MSFFIVRPLIDEGDLFRMVLDARLREWVTSDDVLGKLPPAVLVPERDHVTNGVPCWCNPDTSEAGLVVHRGGQ